MADATTTDTMLSGTPATRPDPAILHFLKEFPGWLAVFLMFIFISFLWYTTGDEFLKRLLDAALASFFTVLIGSARRPNNTTSVQTETVQTPQLQTNSMDNATVNAETVTAGPTTDPDKREEDV